jgi:lipid II:glycine glycyltransferase (peptidoglycan interpeptide bridge formation enzyme)
LWSQIKASLGWTAVRLVVRRGGRIVAGAQLLKRPLSLMGVVGYVPKGPLIAQDDPLLTELVILELKRIARAHGIRNLVIQPPDNGHTCVHHLSRWGFRPSPAKISLGATIFIDLTQDLDSILKHMKPKTRYNIRLGQRSGITVCEGTDRDLSTFHTLLTATGQRQHFPPDPIAYLAAMWRILNPHGHFKLFLAKYQTEVVSGLLAIPFGDTVIYKRGAWSGHHGELRPNEVMHWTAISWAKSRGYHYYDFDGIDASVVNGPIRGEPLSTPATQTVARFKLGFGGQIRLLPDTYNSVSNPFLRWTYNTVYPKMAHSSLLTKIVNRIRKH